jgi:hypothetical protein
VASSELNKLYEQFYKDYPFLDSSLDPFSSTYVIWLEKRHLALVSELEALADIPELLGTVARQKLIKILQ